MSDAEPSEHERMEALFSDFLDGELGAPDQAALEQHLAGCERCRGELDAMKRTLAAMKGAGRSDTPSPEFMNSLREQIRTRSRGRFFGGRRHSYRLEIASLITLVLAVAVYVVIQLVQPLLFVR